MLSVTRWLALILSMIKIFNKVQLFTFIANKIILLNSFFYSTFWYFKLKNKIKLNKDEWGIICPFGVGDTYLVCALLNSFKKKHGGNIVLIMKIEHCEIAEMFSKMVKRIEFIKFSKINLAIVTRFTSFKIGHIFIGHPLFLRKNYLSGLGQQGIELLSVYRKIFELDPTCELSKPEIKQEYEKSSHIKFSKLGLIPGKTVILVTSANSGQNLPISFWNDLVIQLKLNDWSVCQNMIGSKFFIENATPIEFSLAEAIPMAEFAGSVVSIRNGFCDLISTAKCKTTVLYVKQNWYSGTFFSGTSLKLMGLSNSALEYEISEESDIKNIINKISYA